MECCDKDTLTIDQSVFDLDNKLLLIGNPNVGKSVVFSALTGVHVMSSNYAGTTVTYTKAKITLDDKEYQLIDVPGTYSLNATSEAEQVAVNFMNSGAKAVICVLDATNLTRNLNLALEVQQYDVPVIYLLNLMDIASRKGIIVNPVELSEELGAIVIPTVAVKNQGLEELKKKLSSLFAENQTVETDVAEAKSDETEATETTPLTQEEMWKRSQSIADKCSSTTEIKLTKLDKLGSAMVKPYPGTPLAILIMVVALGLIVGGGKALRVVLFIPLINNTLVPLIQNVIGSFGLPEMLENILIGDCGIFVISFEWILSLILPYVVLFYVVFTFLEDCGVLPRMAVLFDNIMRKMGVQGGSLISLVMGYGCAVPAIIGTRNATTRKERIIITSMVCFAVPCISQIGALSGLLGDTPLLLLGVFALSFVVIAAVGFVVGKLLQGKIDPILIEIPNLLMPEKKAYSKKLLVRLKSFVLEAEGPMMLAIVIASICIETGIMDVVSTACEPFIATVLGLPKEAVSGLLLGIIRREMTVFALAGMELTNLQLFVGATVSLLYLPCLSVFGVIAKEFDAKVALGIGVGTFTTAIGLGAVVNLVGQIFV